MILEKALNKYNANHCQCCFPRYVQIVSINCFDYGHSFKAYETEFLIEKSRKYFETKKIEHKEEGRAELWKCKKCNSEFEYYWSDLSIALDRTRLKLKKLNAKQIGKSIKNPIPLYKGLMGYSYPTKNSIANVNFDQFKSYILEEEYDDMW